MQRLATRRTYRPALGCLSAAPTWRLYSTDHVPPLLESLKGDLKTAMRAKDAPRLSVLRAILAANLNASKTSSPIRTDLQLVGLMRKLLKTSQDAFADAQAAGRADLADKEQQQSSILEEYIAGSGIQTLDEAGLRTLVQEAIEASKAAGTAEKSLRGDVMKRTMTSLDGKDVDRQLVASLVKELTKS